MKPVLTIFVAGIAPVFSVLVVIDCISKPGKTLTAECAVASVLFNVSPLNGALVPLVKPVNVNPPDLPVYCITSLWTTGTYSGLVELGEVALCIK